MTKRFPNEYSSRDIKKEALDALEVAATTPYPSAAYKQVLEFYIDASRQAALEEAAEIVEKTEQGFWPSEKSAISAAIREAL